VGSIMTRFNIYEHFTPNDITAIELEVDWIAIEAHKGNPLCYVSIGLNLKIEQGYNEFVEFHQITQIMDSWNMRMPLIMVKCYMTQNIENKAYRFYKLEECRGINIIPNKTIGYNITFTCILADMKTNIGNVIIDKYKPMPIL
jgi:hypothetical protein